MPQNWMLWSKLFTKEVDVGVYNECAGRRRLFIHLIGAVPKARLVCGQ